MPNTVFGPYIQTAWSGTTGINITRLDNLENGPIYALHGYNGDLLSPYVDHGIVASKDGTVLNQLNVTAGRAYVTVLDSSGLASLALIATVSSTASQFLTSTPSTTYYLFLKNDGTWQWGTTSTGPASSLSICSATTDGSGNISVVTDTRQLGTSLLPNAEGGVALSGGIFSGYASSGFGLSWPGAPTSINPVTVTRAGTYLVTTGLQSDCVGAAEITLDLVQNGSVISGQGDAIMGVDAGKTFTLHWSWVVSCKASDVLACRYYQSLGTSTSHSGLANFFLTAIRVGN